MEKVDDDIVIEWMHKILVCSWKSGRLPDDWTETVIMPSYGGKDGKDKCKNYREICLFKHTMEDVWKNRNLEAEEGNRIQDKWGAWRFQETIGKD